MSRNISFTFDDDDDDDEKEKAKRERRKPKKPMKPMKFKDMVKDVRNADPDEKE